MSKSMYVYIMSNKKYGTLYIGVTNDLIRRVYEHRNKLIDGFTKRYNLVRLVYFEEIIGENEAIEREKFLKKAFRKFKIRLIEQQNPEWQDLYEQLLRDYNYMLY